MGILIGIIILSLIMIIHESGHFIAGRLLGFRIKSFNIFMGPKLFSRRGKDGIEYTWRLLPIGASVAFHGEADEEEERANVDGEVIAEDDPGLFYRRPRWARAIVIAMGPMVNFISAFIATAIIVVCYGVTTTQVAELVPGSRAEQAQIEVGDQVLSYNGYKLNTILDLSTAKMISDPSSADLKIEKSNGDIVDLHFDNLSGETPLGISFAQDKSFGTVIHESFYYPLSIVRSTIHGLAMMIRGEIAAKDGLAGPIGIVNLVDQSVEAGGGFAIVMYRLLMIFVLLSTAIGFTNLLPIPPLDGHLLSVILIEAIIRRDLPPKFKQAVVLAGFVLMIALAAYVIYLDVTRLIA